MSSYDSNASGYLPTQYPRQAPPYPTTPGPPWSSSQGYPPPMPPQQQQTYSSSPTYSHSEMPHPHHPYHHNEHHQQQPQYTSRPRTYSTSSTTYPTQPPQQSQPPPPPPQSSSAIPIRQPNPQHFQYPASYPPPAGYAPYAPPHRRSTSEYSTSPHDNGSSGRTSEDNNSSKYMPRHAASYHGELDPDTEREYERRYARERRMERRPTLGGSLLTMFDTVGKAFGGSARH